MTGMCESLVQEHEVIERVLDALEREAERVRSGESVDSEFFTTAISFVRQFADGLHHQKEEVVLFPALCDAGMPKEGGPVGVMLYEHDEGRGHIRAMEAALQSDVEGSTKARQQLVNETLAYVALLRAHIQKENMILFPMAEKVLDVGQQDLARRQFAEAEKQHAENSARHREWAASLRV